MHFDVITLFPEIFNAYLGESIMKRAVKEGLFTVNVHNLRDSTRDRHRTVDDTPYGGGPGMVIKADVVGEAINKIKSKGGSYLTIMLSPQGRPYSQETALRLSREDRDIILLCGRYEGFDERVVTGLVDEEISAGDFILTGGELPALMVMDSTVRLIPGVLGDEQSLEDESFAWGILDYPHYTRPSEWNGAGVPDVLLSGNHAAIGRWRRREALRKTLKIRPDLLRKAGLDDEDVEMILNIKEEA